MQTKRPRATLYYIHDPMCSWCWGFRPVFDALVDRLPDTVELAYLLGGLAPDTDQPMPDAMREQLQTTWRRIQERIPGTRFNFDFWRNCEPRRSTWPACRAVIAARALDPPLEKPMITAIQHAYYLEARNPSNPDTLIALAVKLGLDRSEFAAALYSPQTQHVLTAETTKARSLGANVFPSLRLATAGGSLPVTVDYQDTAPMIRTIDTMLVGHAESSVTLSHATSLVGKAQPAGKGRAQATVCDWEGKPFPRIATQPARLVARPLGSRCATATRCCVSCQGRGHCLRNAP